jgi:hypothetical protein
LSIISFFGINLSFLLSVIVVVVAVVVVVVVVDVVDDLFSLFISEVVVDVVEVLVLVALSFFSLSSPSFVLVFPLESDPCNCILLTLISFESIMLIKV